MKQNLVLNLSSSFFSLPAKCWEYRCTLPPLSLAIFLFLFFNEEKVYLTHSFTVVVESQKESFKTENWSHCIHTKQKSRMKAYAHLTLFTLKQFRISCLGNGSNSLNKGLILSPYMPIGNFLWFIHTHLDTILKCF